MIDPWLVGSEIDGFSWFNKQWHKTLPVSIEKLSKYQIILISQPFSDHCHEETLNLLKEVPIFAVPKACKRLKKTFSVSRLTPISELNKPWLKVGEIELSFLKAPARLKATFNALLIKFKDALIVYCPHGYVLTSEQRKALKYYEIKLLITCFSKFSLPSVLGGAVNPGLRRSIELINSLNPKFVIQTHDEDKNAVGIVKKIAKTNYPSPRELSENLGPKFINMDSLSSSLVL